MERLSLEELGILFKLKYRNLIPTTKQDKTMSFPQTRPTGRSGWSLKELFCLNKDCSSFLSSSVIVPWWDRVRVRTHKASKDKKNPSLLLVASLLFNVSARNWQIFAFLLEIGRRVKMFFNTIVILSVSRILFTAPYNLYRNSDLLNS